MYQPALHIVPPHPANRLGLLYQQEAAALPWTGWIDDAHLHISGLESARRLLTAAGWFNIRRFWSQSPLEEVDELRQLFGDRIEFVAVPRYDRRDEPHTFTTDWLRRIEQFRAKGSRIVKFWAAPRGKDFHPALALDHPIRLEGMKLAQSLGMMFMVHIADPDTWFATHYKDHHRYGTKAQQYEPFCRLLEQFHDRPWLAAHMAGDPEHLDHLQDLLDRYPHLHLDMSATKWMVRELSKQPAELASFLRRNPGRVLFGSDLVVNAKEDPATAVDHDASRYWALRTLLETDYDGPSPIVDPDLPLVDPSLPADAAPRLCGAHLDAATLKSLYGTAAQNLLAKAYAL